MLWEELGDGGGGWLHAGYQRRAALVFQVVGFAITTRKSAGVFEAATRELSNNSELAATV